MGSPFLYFAGAVLSSAELTAACLDGHLVALGEGYLPADAVETAALRAASLSPILGTTLAATHLSAAWIHGALPDPPPRHTAQRGVPHRLHHVLGRRLLYRDPFVGAADLARCGGVLVTTATRTLADLARVDDPAHRRAAALMVATGTGRPERALTLLDDAPPVPGKRAARALLEELAQHRPALDEGLRTT